MADAEDITIWTSKMHPHNYSRRTWRGLWKSYYWD